VNAAWGRRKESDEYRSSRQNIAVYFPEDHKLPGYHMIQTGNEVVSELALEQNGYIRCPVHGGAWAKPGTITVLDGVRKRVVRTESGFALLNEERSGN
jgi:hypothetical protein